MIQHTIIKKQIPSTNISMLQTVANGLCDLKDEMVF